MDDVDGGQPWQTQYAERLSRSIDQLNEGQTPTQALLLCLALLFIAVVVAFFATTAWRSAFG